MDQNSERKLLSEIHTISRTLQQLTKELEALRFVVQGLIKKEESPEDPYNARIRLCNQGLENGI